MRIYLICSLALSIVLPLVILPIQWNSQLESVGSLMNSVQLQVKQSEFAISRTHINQSNMEFTPQIVILYSILIIYLIGFLYKIYLFSNHLKAIIGLINKSPRIKESNYWIVDFRKELPAFSFFNYIFINNKFKNVSNEELQLIKNHEIVHVKQYHTLDLISIELAGAVFWFNPLIKYLRKSLREIHEFIADEKTAGQGENKRNYAQLLVNLVSEGKEFYLATSFTGEQIKRRLLIMAKPRTSPKRKLMFIILVPLTAMLLLSFSYFKNPLTNSEIRNEVKGFKLELKKYCGVYFPSKREINFGLEPMEIILKDNKLFANGTIALHFEADSIFSYTDNSARTLKFDLNSKKEVTGCSLLKFETKGSANYIVLKGEYLKGKQVK